MLPASKSVDMDLILLSRARSLSNNLRIRPPTEPFEARLAERPRQRSIGVAVSRPEHGANRSEVHMASVLP